jgi:hypothetical protein
LGTTGGTSTAFTVTATPTITSLVTGASYSFKANAANGATPTLKIDALVAKTLKRQGTALVGNEFIANDLVEVVYDGTDFQIVNVSQAPLYLDRTNNKVGIGTTAPADLLEVAGTSFNPQYWTSYNNTAGGTNLMIQKSRGASVGTYTIVQSGDVLGSIDFAGANGTTFTSAANISGQVDGTPGATNDMPGRLVFATSSDGSGSPTERMRIACTGRIAIGTTSTSAGKFTIQGEGTSGSTWGLWVQNSAGAQMLANLDSGLIQTGTATQSPYNLTTASAANLVVDSSGSLLRSTSSRRYKTNIEPYNNGLEDVLVLQPKFYNGINDGDKLFAGLIAEDVHDAGLHEFVVYNAEGEPDALAYGNMVALAFKAIQELNAKVEALQARVAELEA